MFSSNEPSLSCSSNDIHETVNVFELPSSPPLPRSRSPPITVTPPPEDIPIIPGYSQSPFTLANSNVCEIVVYLAVFLFFLGTFSHITPRVYISSL